MRRTPRQVLYDVLAWLGLSVLAAAAGPDPFAEPGVFAVVTGGRVLLLGLAVLVGRAWPLAASVILLPLGPWDFGEGLATTTWDFTGGVATTDQLWPLSLVSVKIFPLSATTLAVLWYAYRTGRSASRAWPATAVFGAAAVIGAGVVLAQGGLLRYWVTMVSGLIGCYVVPYLLGTLRRLLLQQRERTQLSVAAQARLRERTRIAHDMHDSLGHDLALIAVRAAGLEIAPGLAPAQAKAAGELRVAASEATERLREIVGLLRDDFDPAPLVPVAADVTDLVERSRDSGMDVSLEVAEGPVPALAYRAVQEGLTNAAKHAPGAWVRVSVSPARISVRNGPARGRATAIPGGMGLTGLRERVRLAGGTMTAGPVDDGFELVVLPLQGEEDPLRA
ncbi:sensor histidine kinase [Nonomuraea dietziae]|uniref:histidine kinase n=1 Tax=Nonomuraea dietziae TaxID=65515 RepID=A0A7W5YNN4_9ACTN|nr:histidine kinase [Nonomuraea dietziae]MBB3727672.1 signal transduction histidine kinase [Nonomuraea dietziae]